MDKDRQGDDAEMACARGCDRVLVVIMVLVMLAMLTLGALAEVYLAGRAD